MPQQEGEQLLSSPHQVHGCVNSRPNQIAKRFVCGIWNPHRRQAIRTVQNRQLLRIASVGLDPFSRLARDHGRRSHGALVPEARELAMNAVPTAACLVAEVELTMLGELLRHLAYGLRRVRNHTDEPYWPTAAVFCNADGDGRLMDVHADE